MPRPFLTQAGSPLVERGANGLRTVTRIYDVDAGGLTAGKVNDEVLLAYGTADEEFREAILVRRSMEQATAEKSGYKTRLVEVYQELLDGEKKTTEEDRITWTTDGRTQMERKYVCYAADAETVAAAVGTVLDGRACANSAITKQGVGCEIVETYISAGRLAQSDSPRNNGRLQLRTLTYFNQVPPTPGGYVRVDTQVRDTDGVPTYTYEFAAGSGEVDRETEYSQCGGTVDGSTGVTRLNIVHLTGSADAEPTWAPVAGLAKISVKMSEDNGYRIWRASFAKGTGLVAQSIDPFQPGLRRVMNVSLGTKVAPAGVVVRDDYRLEAGFTVYTVESIQTDDGGTLLTGVSVTAEDYVDFTYPGRAKAFEELYGGRYMLDVYQDPPVTAKVLATVSTSYVTSTVIGTLTPALWNPTRWACIRAQWIGLGNEPSNYLRALPGYRAVSETALTRTSSSLAPNNVSLFGQVVFGNTTARVQVTGGPADPGGNSYTLEAKVDSTPAFTSTAGTKYYRRVVVVAAIPAQSDLPV